MPVETAYKIMKNWLASRINGKMLNDMGLPLESQLRMAMRSVSESESGPRHCFHQAGYV